MQLMSIVVAGSGNTTILAPIGEALKSFNVELVTNGTSLRSNP